MRMYYYQDQVLVFSRQRIMLMLAHAWVMSCIVGEDLWTELVVGDFWRLLKVGIMSWGWLGGSAVCWSVAVFLFLYVGAVAVGHGFFCRWELYHWEGLLLILENILHKRMMKDQIFFTLRMPGLDKLDIVRRGVQRWCFLVNCCRRCWARRWMVVVCYGNELGFYNEIAVWIKNLPTRSGCTDKTSPLEEQTGEFSSALILMMGTLAKFNAGKIMRICV